MADCDRVRDRYTKSRLGTFQHIDAEGLSSTAVLRKHVACGVENKARYPYHGSILVGKYIYLKNKSIDFYIMLSFSFLIII